MAGPDDRGGFVIRLPDGDPLRDMTGLIRAILRNDEVGQRVILANADLEPLVHVLASTLAAWLTAAARSRSGDVDPDAPSHALTEEELQAAEAILLAGISGPDDADPW